MIPIVDAKERGETELLINATFRAATQFFLAASDCHRWAAQSRGKRPDAGFKLGASVISQWESSRELLGLFEIAAPSETILFWPSWIGQATRFGPLAENSALQAAKNYSRIIASICHDSRIQAFKTAADFAAKKPERATRTYVRAMRAWIADRFPLQHWPPFDFDADVKMLEMKLRGEWWKSREAMGARPTARATELDCGDRGGAPDGMVWAELANRLCCDSKTVAKYADSAGVKRPGRGQRNYICPGEDVEKIARELMNKGGNRQSRNAAKQLLPKSQ